jgi:hypothetical protein
LSLYGLGHRHFPTETGALAGTVGARIVQPIASAKYAVIPIKRIEIERSNASNA